MSDLNTIYDAPDCKEPMTFNKIPIHVQLNIFSYLEVRDLLKCSLVCKYWNTLSNDDVLWMHLLNAKMSIWKKVGNATFPELCWQQGHTSKEIYHRNYVDNKKTGYFSGSVARTSWWKNLAKSVLQPKPLDIVVFGPGLDSGSHSSSIIRFLISCRTTDFHVTRLYPGDKIGIGSGLCVAFQDIQLVLMVLYSNFKKERECVTGEQRIAKSRLYEHIYKEDGTVDYVCNPNIQQVCERANGFVFVIDGTTDLNTSWHKFELFTMINHGHSTDVHSELKPVIVWTCVPPNSPSSKYSTTTAKQLELSRLKQPWKVWEVQVENHLPAVDESFEWLKNIHAKSWWR